MLVSRLLDGGLQLQDVSLMTQGVKANKENFLITNAMFLTTKYILQI